MPDLLLDNLSDDVLHNHDNQNRGTMEVPGAALSYSSPDG